MNRLRVFVPIQIAAVRTRIAAGSAIIGRQIEQDNTVIVAFEGGVYGQENLRTFIQRCQSAADVLTRGFPSRTRLALPATDLVEIGTYVPSSDPDASVQAKIALYEDLGEDRLTAWLGQPVNSEDLLLQRGVYTTS